MPRHIVPKEIVHERGLFKRIAIAWGDLEDARAALNRLGGLHGDPGLATDDKILKRALITEVIIAYGRLFTPTRGVEEIPGCIPASFVRHLSSLERTVHNRVLGLRDKEYAHSDGDVSGVSVGAQQGLLVPSRRILRHYSIALEDLTVLDAIFTKVHIYLYDEMHRLYPKLSPYGNF